MRFVRELVRFIWAHITVLMRASGFFAACAGLALLTCGAASTDPAFEGVKPIPPPGIAISETDRTELEKGVTDLNKEIELARMELGARPALLDLLPDAQIYLKAVDWALRYNEFYRTNEIQTARQLLTEGMARVRALREGQAPWASATGLVVRAYVSRIDGSVQPYGLVVPPSYRPDSSHRYRLDFWCHGRGEQLSELSFLSDRERNRGEFAPADTIVLHLYGRYCNANRFAGETDLFEALDGPPVMTDRSWSAHFRKQGGQWAVTESVDDLSLHKQHGLQGPIDDAFMDAFIMVRPTGQPMNEKVGAWATAEMDHAIDHWRRQFRGEARIKSDADLTDVEMAANNLVIWGDPQSNKLLAEIASRLPILWDAHGVHTPQEDYPADKYVPVLIYPNPLNPKRYVVINSGFTFREFDYTNNARQSPKLPD